MSTYDFAEVLKHCDVTRNQLARWCDAEIIRPKGGGSPGKRRVFTCRNLVEIAVCAELDGLGVDEPQIRRTVQALDAIWRQPDEPMSLRRADKPTYRDMTILWLAFQRYEDTAGVHVYPLDATDLISRLTDGAVDGSGIAETGIAIPIARIIADLERATGDVFDFAALLQKKLAEALKKGRGNE